MSWKVRLAENSGLWALQADGGRIDDQLSVQDQPTTSHQKLLDETLHTVGGYNLERLNTRTVPQQVTANKPVWPKTAQA